MRRNIVLIFAPASLLLLTAFVLSRPQIRFRSYQPIMRAISAGKLPIRPDGGVALAGQLAGIVPGNVVCQSRLADGRLLLLFPTWFGRGADLDGYLYASGPLSARG